jgi:HAD superfamily hydrolase (TIGR01509 family)
MFAGITHFLFDLDGTLVDSSGLHDAAFRTVLAPKHPDLLAGFDYREVAGLPTPAALMQIGVAQDDIQCLAVAKQAYYRGSLANLKPMPGAKEALKLLQDRGARIAIVSSASRESALKALAATQLAPFAAVVIAAEDVAAAKPAPDPFLAALDHFGARPSDSIAIEDAPSGIASARAAGLKVIGMHHESVRGLSDLYFADFSALAKVLT